MIDLFLDSVIALLLIVLAVGALFSPTLFGGVALFVAFGVTMALAWVRMEAVDLALAEAIIGAGLTGALLLIALRQSQTGGMLPRRKVSSQKVSSQKVSSQKAPSQNAPPQKMHLLSAAALALPLVTLLIWAAWPARELSSPLPALVQANLEASSVLNPVTATLMNFRAWDTLLELVVLLLAFLGVKQLLPTHKHTLAPWPLLLAWSRHLAPLLVIAGCYIVWRGSDAPGGAFQAGALLAAGAIMLRLALILPPLRWSQWRLRVLVLGGVAVFVALAVLTAWLGEGWLKYPKGWSKLLIVLVEVMAALSIATTLTLLVVGEGEEIQS